MRNINYKKYHTRYLVVDYIVGALACIIFILVFITDRKIFFSKRLIRDINSNWQITPIIDIIKVPLKEECPKNYERLFNETFQGANKGCLCEDISVKESIIYEGNCIDSRDKIKCKNVNEIPPQKMKNWRNSNLCIMRMKTIENTTFYINQFKSQNISSKLTNCPINSKKCGVLDNQGNVFCVEKGDECPVNYFFISNNFNKNTSLYKYNMIALSNNYTLYFTNQAINSTIYSNFKISDGSVCLDPVEHNNTSKIHPLFKDQDPYDCDNEINGTRNDDRYIKYDSYQMSSFYKDNDIDTKLKTLPNWEQSYFNNNSQIELFARPYIGWKTTCNSDLNRPEIVLWISKYLNDITQLQNELFYFHVIVMISYLLVNIIVKWRLIKERIEFLYLLLLEGIYVALCLIEVVISIVGILKFRTFYNTNYELNLDNCSDKTTTLIFNYLGNVFYDFSLHFYLVALFSIISCFMYPINSTFVYIQTTNVEAKELQNLVAK